jgi:hypothetical protein
MRPARSSRIGSRDEWDPVIDGRLASASLEVKLRLNYDITILKLPFSYYMVRRMAQGPMDRDRIAVGRFEHAISFVAKTGTGSGEVTARMALPTTEHCRRRRTAGQSDWRGRQAGSG